MKISTLLRVTGALAASALAFAAADPAAAQAKKIKIGFVTTLSGPNAAYGVDMRNSFELALDHLGRKMGGIPVEVIYEDDEQKPEVGKQERQSGVSGKGCQGRVDFGGRRNIK